MYALNPTRELGLINGQYLYVHRLNGRWPNVITYGHVTAMEGSLTTYRFNNAYHYVMRSRYPINNGVDYLEIQRSTGITMPAFLKRAKPARPSIEN